jgi:predicted PurR-regulated permease PerM
MRRKKIPNLLAVLIIIIGIIAFGIFLAAFVSTSVTRFSNNLPTYQTQLSEKTDTFLSWLNAKGIDVSDELINEYLNPGVAMGVVANGLSGLRLVLTNAFMILLTISFILLEASGFPKKIYAAMKYPEESLANFSKIMDNVNRYLAIKTLTSLFTGIAVGIILWIIGLDFALLWGLLAYMLNYIPSIGSVIAAIPAVLLAIIQLGPGPAALIALAYLIINLVFGSIIEPRIMGRGLGLSTLVVFLSLVFWGWVLGPVGMLFSVLLTMIIKLALENNEDTRWIAILLG